MHLSLEFSKRLASPENTETQKLNKDLTIYPNPFTDKLTIQLPTNNFLYRTIELIDVTGKVVINKIINIDDELVQLNTHELPSGIYIYRIKADEDVITGKVFKK